MSRFAKVNLLEVEDSVAGRVEGLEGRFGRKHLDSRDLGVSLFRYAPNLRSPMAHSHKEQEEAYVVVAGSGRILLDDETQELRTWDVIRVAPEVVRAFEAGPDGLDIIAVGGPKPEEGDGVRATATWPTRSACPGRHRAARSSTSGLAGPRARPPPDRGVFVASRDLLGG
jgi:quercetin dioxygenase-like cupin family protein